MALLAAAGPAFAHHSGAMFDREKSVALVGEIKEYQFQNPHVWIEVMVPTAGKKAPVQWGIEGEGPTMMVRLGLTKANLKPGDKVTIHAHPLRDGRPGGSFMDITLPDGRTLTAGRVLSAPAVPAQSQP
ncbi:MAG: DUF6152 family protein [Caulobacteraceae bacterium]